MTNPRWPSFLMVGMLLMWRGIEVYYPSPVTVHLAGKEWWAMGYIVAGLLAVSCVRLSFIRQVLAGAVVSAIYLGRALTLLSGLSWDYAGGALVDALVICALVGGSWGITAAPHPGRPNDP